MMTCEHPFKWVILKSRLLDENEEKRVNASSYSIESLQVLQILEKLKKKNIPVVSFREFCDKIFYPPRFKRTYTRDGTLFLSSKDILNFVLTGKRVQNVEQDYLVKKNWILVTRSGSVGRVMLTNKNFDDIGVSEHVIRVIPQKQAPVGYLYSYLSSSFGQPLLTSKIFGGVVKEIEPSHISNIPLPLLPESDISKIDKKALEAHKLREEAQELLLNAEKMFYKELELPLLDDNVIDYFGRENGKLIKAFTLTSNEFVTTQIRLNAYSYLPISRYARKILTNNKGKFDLKKLGDPEVSQKVFTPPRFKRIYVKNEKDGIPLLQGSHIPMLKYFDIKLIWNKMETLNEYVVKRNWILVTCSGTVGRVFLVSKLCEGWTATNHMTRIIPSEKINAGYLAIFLQSLYEFSQLQTLSYGGVVEELGEAGELISEILVPIPSSSIQEKIGNLVIEAYEKKDQANLLENEGIKILEKRLIEAAK
ncbi:MAG: restriction endonuclease subunit S [Candidatus Jordarchaeaceae archaeon]